VTDERKTVRIAAVGDVHFPSAAAGPAGPPSPLAALGGQADVLLLCGDLTNHGLPDEARALARELAAVKIPIVAVLGNHEYESGKEGEVRQIVTDAGVTVLDGDACEIAGVGFAGVKGFGGGFGERALQAWGEESIKRFVHDAVDEALKLESALARLRTPHRVVLMHYSPIQATVQGEPPEIFPFLGSSRLEEPLTRYPVTAVFHGHAHHGTPDGRTRGDVPVYNVALPLLRQAFPDLPPFRILELPVSNGNGQAPTSSRG
jgi:Icc-related predicted phosphoesterase